MQEYNFKKLNLFLVKTENVQISFKGICAKIYKNVQKVFNPLPFLQGFPMSYKKS